MNIGRRDNNSYRKPLDSRTLYSAKVQLEGAATPRSCQLRQEELAKLLSLSPTAPVLPLLCLRLSLAAFRVLHQDAKGTTPFLLQGCFLDRLQDSVGLRKGLVAADWCRKGVRC